MLSDFFLITLFVLRLRSPRQARGKQDYSCLCLYHLTIVTIFAIHNLFAIGCVTRFKLVRAMLTLVEMLDGVFVNAVFGTGSRAGAFSVPEFEWISAFDASGVTAMKAPSWNWDLHMSIKTKFTRNNLVISPAITAGYDFLGNSVRNFTD